MDPGLSRPADGCVLRDDLRPSTAVPDRWLWRRALTLGLNEGAVGAFAMIVEVSSGVLRDWTGRRKPPHVPGSALGTVTKPVFALTVGPDLMLAARGADRVGKGIRSVLRDPPVSNMPRRRAAGRLRAVSITGYSRSISAPLIAVALMLLWPNDFRAIVWVTRLLKRDDPWRADLPCPDQRGNSGPSRTGQRDRAFLMLGLGVLNPADLALARPAHWERCLQEWHCGDFTWG